MGLNLKQPDIKTDFQIMKLARTSDADTQIMRLDARIELPITMTWSAHAKVCKNAIKQMRNELDQAERDLDRHFKNLVDYNG